MWDKRKGKDPFIGSSTPCIGMNYLLNYRILLRRKFHTSGGFSGKTGHKAKQ